MSEAPYRDRVGEEMRGILKRQRISETLLPVLASALASVITGTALVATRFVVSGSDGLTIATLRYLVAASCLVPLIPIVSHIRVPRRDLLPIAGLGLLYFGFFPWCISAAMKFTTASGGAVVLACTPAATLLLGKLTGREDWSVRKGLGVICAIVGAAIAIGHVALDFQAAWRGDLVMILATLLGAVYAIFSKPYLTEYSPLAVTAIAMTTGALGLLVFWAAIDLPNGFPHLTSTGWLTVAYIGIAGGALSFFLYAWSLGQTAPTTTMIMLPLNPITAVIAGSLFLKEPLTVGLFLGLTLVVLGIFLVVGVTAPPRTSATSRAGQ